MNTKKTKIAPFRFKNTLLCFLSVFFLISLVLYIYFILSAVVQVVLRQELHVAVTEVETYISELEAEYFAQTATISKEMIHEYGLVATTPAAYVEVSPGNRLTRRD